MKSFRFDVVNIHFNVVNRESASRILWFPLCVKCLGLNIFCRVTICWHVETLGRASLRSKKSVPKYCCPLKMETIPVIDKISTNYDALSKTGLTFQRFHYHHNPWKNALQLKCWKPDWAGCGGHGQDGGAAPAKGQTNGLTFTKLRLWHISWRSCCWLSPNCLCLGIAQASLALLSTCGDLGWPRRDRWSCPWLFVAFVSSYHCQLGKRTLDITGTE